MKSIPKMRTWRVEGVTGPVKLAGLPGLGLAPCPGSMGLLVFRRR